MVNMHPIDRDEESDIGSEIEKHKQNQISQHKDGHDKASWAEELASASEENVCLCHPLSHMVLHANRMFAAYRSKLTEAKSTILPLTSFKTN